MTRTTGLKRAPHPLAIVDPVSPPIARTGKSHYRTTGKKGPPVRYESQSSDQSASDEEEGVEEEGDDLQEEQEGDEDEEQDDEGDDVVTDDESEHREGMVETAVNQDDSEDYSPRQLELIQLASDLSANDDLLSCIFVDTFGSMAEKDDLGVYYHQGDFIKPYIDRKQVIEMAQPMIVHGKTQEALDRCLRLPIIRDHLLKLRSNSQIKKFVAHLKRYLMLYHPTSRIEIRTTDRYRFATQKSELAVHATTDLDPGLTEYVIMDMQNVGKGIEDPKSASSTQSKHNNAPSLHGLPNTLNGIQMSDAYAHLGNNLSAEPKPPMLVLDEITGAMEVMPKVWEQRLSGNAIDDHESSINPVSAAQQRKGTRNVPYGDMELDTNGGLGGAQAIKKTAEIRDFSVVNSGRQGLMLFLGPGRFINHDCSPNVELITTKRNVITFRVLRKIRVGEELTTWYGDNYFGHGNRDCLCLTCELNHRGGFSRVAAESASEDVSRVEDAAHLSKKDDSASVTTGQEPNAESVISEDPTSSIQQDKLLIVTTERGASVEPIELQDQETEVYSDEEEKDESVNDAGDTSSNNASRRSGRILASSLSQQPAIEKDGLVSRFVQGLEGRKRYPKRFGSASAIPHRMTSSASASSSARPSPSPSASGTSPTKPASRNTRRAAARGRERTSNMIHNPFGFSKKPGSLGNGGDGLEHLSDMSHIQSERDEPGTLRCTVCLQIMEPVWISNRYIEQCPRCIRHKAIYGVKWPARSKAEEQPYPPVNMRPSWWIPPKISKYQYRSIVSPEHNRINFEEQPPMDFKDSETERLEQEARREAKRLNRREVLNEQAAAKFRKDLEAARDYMKRFRQEYAKEKEALKSKPKLHSGGGNWGRYEYVWEEEERPLVLEAGSKRSNRATSFPNSPPRIGKKRRLDEMSNSDDRATSSRVSRRREESAKSQSKGKGRSKGTEMSKREKHHPANRRANRPRPVGPIFSAIPASPSREVLPDNDFDILPISTVADPNRSNSPIRLDNDDDNPDGDIYDSDVEIIATNVSCAVREGRLEEEYGSNINPISLLGEDDNVIGDSDGNSDNDISYSTRFDASALHLMPVTPGSVKAGGVPNGTTSDMSTGKQPFRDHPSYATGISPLKYQEIFRGTLSSPDVHPDVQPESYKQPKALLDRGKGTRAALEAEERNRTLLGGTGHTGRRPKAAPLLHSAEAEIARARQAAAFLENAKRKPIQKPAGQPSFAYPEPTAVAPPRSPSPFGDMEHDEEEPTPHDQEHDLETMLDTIVSSQLMDLDQSNEKNSLEESPPFPVVNAAAMDDDCPMESQDSPDPERPLLDGPALSLPPVPAAGALADNQTSPEVNLAVPLPDLASLSDMDDASQDGPCPMTVQDDQQTRQHGEKHCSNDALSVRPTAEEKDAEDGAKSANLGPLTVSEDNGMSEGDNQRASGSSVPEQVEAVADAVANTSSDTAASEGQSGVLAESIEDRETELIDQHHHSQSPDKGDELAEGVDRDATPSPPRPSTIFDSEKDKGPEVDSAFVGSTVAEVDKPIQPTTTSCVNTSEDPPANIESVGRIDPTNLIIEETVSAAETAEPNEPGTQRGQNLAVSEPMPSATLPDVERLSDVSEQSAAVDATSIDKQEATAMPAKDVLFSSEAEDVPIVANAQSTDTATTPAQAQPEGESNEASVDSGLNAGKESPTQVIVTAGQNLVSDTVPATALPKSAGGSDREMQVEVSTEAETVCDTSTMQVHTAAGTSSPKSPTPPVSDTDDTPLLECTVVPLDPLVPAQAKGHEEPSGLAVDPSSSIASDSAPGTGDVFATAMQPGASTLPMDHNESAMSPIDPGFESHFDYQASDSIMPAASPIPSAVPSSTHILERPLPATIAPAEQPSNAPELSPVPSVVAPPMAALNASRKRKRAGHPAPIPENVEVFVISSSDDDVEIIKPPKRAATVQAVQRRSAPSTQTNRSTVVQGTSFQSPAAKKTAVVQSPSAARSSDMPVTSSPSAPPTASTSGPDPRRNARKGALFLPSTKKALESRRTIQALRRIQLVSAGITDFREGDAPLEEGTTITADGMDTAWGADASAGAATIGWDVPAAQPSDNANGWGNPDPSSGPNAGAETAPATSNGSDGWGNMPATTSGNTGWGDAPSTTEVNADWGVSSAATTTAGAGYSWEPTSVAPTSSANAITWGDPPPVTPKDPVSESIVPAQHDSAATATVISTNSWGASDAVPSPADDGWGVPSSTTSNGHTSAGWGAALDPPAHTSAAWDSPAGPEYREAQQAVNAPSSQAWESTGTGFPGAKEEPKISVDPNAWEPEPQPAAPVNDWSVWDVPSTSDIPSGWGIQITNHHPSDNNGRAPTAQQSEAANGNTSSSDWQDRSDKALSDRPRADVRKPNREPPIKPRRSVAEDFWQDSESPRAKTPPPAKTAEATSGWGAWEPSGSSAQPIDDGWGNPLKLTQSSNAVDSSWSAGRAGKPPSRREDRDVPRGPRSESSRHGSVSRRSSRDQGYGRPASPGARPSFDAPDWRDRTDGRSPRTRSRGGRDDKEKHSRSRGASSRERHKDRESRSSARESERRDRRHGDSTYDRNPDDRRSERRESSRGHPDHRSSDRDRHSDRRESDRRESSHRHSERMDRDQQKDSDRQERHRDRHHDERRESRRRRDSPAGDTGRRASEERHSERIERDWRDLYDNTSRRRESEGRDDRRRQPAGDDKLRERDSRPSEQRAYDGRHLDRLDAARDAQYDFPDPEPRQPANVPQAITSSNTVPLGTRNRYATSTSEETPRSTLKHDEWPSSLPKQTSVEATEEPGEIFESPIPPTSTTIDADTTAWGVPVAAENGAKTSTGSGWDSWEPVGGSTAIPHISSGW